MKRQLMLGILSIFISTIALSTQWSITLTAPPDNETYYLLGTHDYPVVYKFLDISWNSFTDGSSIFNIELYVDDVKKLDGQPGQYGNHTWSDYAFPVGTHSIIVKLYTYDVETGIRKFVTQDQSTIHVLRGYGVYYTNGWGEIVPNNFDAGSMIVNDQTINFPHGEWKDQYFVPSSTVSFSGIDEQSYDVDYKMKWDNWTHFSNPKYILTDNIQFNYTVSEDNVQFIANYIPIKEVSGSISQNTTWAGFESYGIWYRNIYRITSSVTVNSGSTLTIAAGTIVRVESGASLQVYGNLIVSGNFSDPVIFTSESGNTPGSWGSIILNGGEASSSSINYAIIQYGAGIQITGGASPTVQHSQILSCTQGITINNSAPYIYYNTISNPSQNGIYGSFPGYTPQIESNKIQRTSGLNYSGINISNGGYPTIIQNDISGYYYGMYIGGGTVSYLWGPSPSNRITSCYRGIADAWGSEVNMGEAESDNSIHNNSTYDLEINNYSYLESYDNYYGGGSPVLYCDGTSSYQITHNQSTDPWSGFSLNVHQSPPQTEAPVIAGMNYTKTNAEVISTDQQADNLVIDSIKVGDGYYLGNQLDEAVARYKALLPSSKYQKRAINRLMRLSGDRSVGGSVSAFMESYLQDNANNPDNIFTLMGIKLKNQKWAEAMSCWDRLTAEYPASYQSDCAQFVKFNYLLYTEKNYDESKVQLDYLKQKFGESTDFKHKSDLEMAEAALGTPDQQDKKFNSKNATNANIEPVSFGATNYPNPFNPTTLIKYSLPEASFVQLSIYDAIGRLISIEVNEYQSAGEYFIHFNAAKLSSGMYFYRISAGGNSLIKKMMYLK